MFIRYQSIFGISSSVILLCQHRYCAYRWHVGFKKYLRKRYYSHEIIIKYIFIIIQVIRINHMYWSAASTHIHWHSFDNQLQYRVWCTNDCDCDYFKLTQSMFLLKSYLFDVRICHTLFNFHISLVHIIFLSANLVILSVMA